MHDPVRQGGWHGGSRQRRRSSARYIAHFPFLGARIPQMVRVVCRTTAPTLPHGRTVIPSCAPYRHSHVRSAGLQLVHSSSRPAMFQSVVLQSRMWAFMYSLLSPFSNFFYAICQYREISRRHKTLNSTLTDSPKRLDNCAWLVSYWNASLYRPLRHSNHHRNRFCSFSVDRSLALNALMFALFSNNQEPRFIIPPSPSV